MQYTDGLWELGYRKDDAGFTILLEGRDGELWWLVRGAR
jgi:hypothetical protein